MYFTNFVGKIPDYDFLGVFFITFALDYSLKLLIMKSEENSKKAKEVHHGRNVKRLREMLGIKQDILAEALKASQQTVSRYECQEVLEEDILNEIAKVLKIPVEAVKNFDEEMAVNIISNTFNEQSVAFQYNFNPVNKIIELYEHLLKVKDEKYALLEKLLNEQQ